MKWKTVEIITLVTRFLGVLFIIYLTLCFGVLEKYNLQDIGDNSAYALYWKCLIISCLVFVLDFVIQIFKLVSLNSSGLGFYQAFLYLFSFVLVILISTSYPTLICDGDRHDVIGLGALEDQIKSGRESVAFDSLYIGIRSLVYSMILIIWVSNKRQ